MRSKIQKSKIKRNQIKPKKKKQISKFYYGLGKILLLLLFVTLISLLIYFILDWSLSLAGKRTIEKGESVESLIAAIESNEYEHSVTLYETIKAQEKLNDKNNNIISKAINKKFKSIFGENEVENSDSYNIVKYFSFYIDESNVEQVITDLFHVLKTTKKSYESYQNTLEHISDLLKDSGFDSIINLNKEKAEIIKASRELYNNAKLLEEENDYINAYNSYIKVSEEDLFYYSLAQNDAINLKNKIKTGLLNTAKTFEAEEDIDNAYYTMKSVPDIIKEDQEVIDYINYITDLFQKRSLVEYKGIVYNMFFHSLALYPEIAFSSSRGQELFDIMATKYEFERTIEKLYEHGYILINASDVYDLYEKDGVQQLKIKDYLLLPGGKKPLIMSMDNVSFTHWAVGFCKRLVIDDKGNLASIVDINGVETMTYDDEHLLILYNFVKKHPDFSYNNAMATIGMSGYESMFGYNTADLNAPNHVSELEQAKKIADKLKQMGFVFANHSFYHFTKSSDISSSYTDLEWLKYDTQKWRQYIEPILGSTNIYITPGGKNFSVAKFVDGDRSDPCYNYLVSQGYQIILSVGRNQAYTNSIIGVTNPKYFYGTSLYMDRYNVDGKSLYKEETRLIDVFGFDNSEIIDPIRAKYK